MRDDGCVRIELPERLCDGSVALRPLVAGDVAAYAAAFRADPELGRLLGAERDPDERSIRARVARRAQRASQGAEIELAIADPGSDAFCGSVILHSFEWQHQRCEIGFWLLPEVRGRDLGARAVSLAVTWALSALNLVRIEITTTPDNHAAAALAKRLGFTREGVLRRRNVERGARVDIVYFGLLRDEWEHV